MKYTYKKEMCHNIGFDTSPYIKSPNGELNASY